MRKILFLLSPDTESSLQELVALSNFSASSVQGVLLNESHGTEKVYSFPCVSLISSEKQVSSSYPSIQYTDMLKMIFEADTVIS